MFICFILVTRQTNKELVFFINSFYYLNVFCLDIDLRKSPKLLSILSNLTGEVPSFVTHGCVIN
jgi:hypothetical protein